MDRHAGAGYPGAPPHLGDGSDSRPFHFQPNTPTTAQHGPHAVLSRSTTTAPTQTTPDRQPALNTPIAPPRPAIQRTLRSARQQSALTKVTRCTPRHSDVRLSRSTGVTCPVSTPTVRGPTRPGTGAVRCPGRAGLPLVSRSRTTVAGRTLIGRSRTRPAGSESESDLRPSRSALSGSCDRAVPSLDVALSVFRTRRLRHCGGRGPRRARCCAHCRVVPACGTALTSRCDDGRLHRHSGSSDVGA